MERLAALDRKIIIKQPVATVSDSGQQRKTFTTWRTTFAKIVERYGNEDAQGGTIVAQTTVEFEVRFKAGLTHQMLIEYNGNTYNIVAITEAQYKGQFYRDRFTKITAVLKDNNTTQQF